MITIFNRRELAITFSMTEQGRIRDILNANKIDYRLKTISQYRDSRARTGTFGQNANSTYEYIFYVNKNDLSQAQAIIAGIYGR